MTRICEVATTGHSSPLSIGAFASRQSVSLTVNRGHVP
jgi:hypothetical protein